MRIDIRSAREIDQSVYEGARRTADMGAELAREAGFDAEGLAVADEVVTPSPRGSRRWRTSST